VVQGRSPAGRESLDSNMLCEQQHTIYVVHLVLQLFQIALLILFVTHFFNFFLFIFSTCGSLIFAEVFTFYSGDVGSFSFLLIRS
jgi:hypothetical protein